MNPLGFRILNVLQASPDGHSMALIVFNVLNRDGYNVTKYEFEVACKNLHDDGCIAYQPVYSSLVDIPIGSLDLLTEPELFQGDVLKTDPAESLVTERISGGLELEAEVDGADPINQPSLVPWRAVAFILALPVIAMQAWKRVQSHAWFARPFGFSLRF
jgi:hypothetical protein